MSTDVIPDHTLHVIARDDDYCFGVLQSRVHEIWSLKQGARMGVGNDPRYSSQRTFETFPFPWPPGQEPPDDPRVQAIAGAAQELVRKRDAWLNPPDASAEELRRRTLTNLYNQRPTWLDLAHRTLDQAVLDAYGWPHELSDEEILSRLLGLNLERAAARANASEAASDGR
jgi:type II restriction/modification system DNA methylase subunit YeeA